MFTIVLILIFALLGVISAGIWYIPRFQRQILETWGAALEKISAVQADTLKPLLGLDKTFENPYSDTNAQQQFYAGEDEPPVELPAWERDDFEEDGWIRVQTQGRDETPRK